ncbi:MAG: hypothetical protein WDA16_00325 [Candidatus Thermoplasmatota archaeon]
MLEAARMQGAFLDDAQPAAVSHAVRDVLERRGALIREHVSSRVRFHSLPTGSQHTWTRAGYVGIFQHVGEKEVEVRLTLRARLPQRLFWATALTDLLIAVLTLIVNPPGTTWFLLAFLTGLALLVAGLLYMNTWKGAREQERALMEEFESEFREHHIGASLVTLDERAHLAAKEALEGEVERVRVEETRKKAPRAMNAKKEKPAIIARLGALKPSFGRKKDESPPVPEESPEEKRARLLARKAELEAQQKRDEP